MKVLSREAANFVANTEVWTVAPDHIDQHFRLLATTPHYPDPDKPLCGLIAVDGDLNAGAIVSGVNGMLLAKEVPPTVTVSIAYPFGTTRDWLMLRYRDLTPSRSLKLEASRSALFGLPCPETGGADAFLAFIENEVKPAIAEAHGVQPGEWTLMGNSLGGLITVHSLLTNPGSFRRYNAISPSVWWERPWMFERAKAFATEAKPVDAALYITAGDRETRALIQAHFETLAEDVRQKFVDSLGGTAPDMVEDSRVIADILARRPGFKVGVKVLDNESHNSIYGAALSQGLRWLHNATDATP